MKGPPSKLICSKLIAHRSSVTEEPQVIGRRLRDAASLAKSHSREKPAPFCRLFEERMAAGIGFPLRGLSEGGQAARCRRCADACLAEQCVQAGPRSYQDILGSWVYSIR